eukprot:gene40503-53560_t
MALAGFLLSSDMGSSAVGGLTCSRHSYAAKEISRDHCWGRATGVARPQPNPGSDRPPNGPGASLRAPARAASNRDACQTDFSSKGNAWSAL